MTNLANSAEPFDMVIRRVQVFDGKEAFPSLRDVGLHGGAIGAVSEAPLQGRRDIDGKGGWVMPGLIDTHLHFFDFRVVTDPDSLAEFVEIDSLYGGEVAKACRRIRNAQCPI